MDLMQKVTPRQNHQSAVWLGNQCYGITQGLARIHGVMGDQMQGGRHGRHGDLKPENLLWFKDKHVTGAAQPLNGMLKISDFGLARFHGTHSKSRRASEAGFTTTQKAPEYDVLHKISPKYDIWSLGCVLLDLTTWYLEGYDAFDNFSKERAKDDEKYPRVTQIAEDTFYVYDQIDRPYKAWVKSSVVNVSKLQVLA